ncbi:MAG: GNAT family N-acetyltransferase [Erysipelotrichales bacterium]|nr:GNAT family N-acetyltransferase [Erysipelotrichales bacterium]
MEFVEITKENIQLAYNYFLSLKTTIPTIYSVSLPAFTDSFLNEYSEGEQMFKELHAYAAIDTDNKIKSIIQYGIPNYEINYDGERIYSSRVGAIRWFDVTWLHEDVGKKLLDRASTFFIEHGISKVYAFSNDYAMSVYAYQGKLYQSEKKIHTFLRLYGFKRHTTSHFYTISLKRMKPYMHNDGINFEPDERIQNRQFFTIKKHQTEIGGMEVYYINSKTVYLSFFYILDDYRGRSWGLQSLLAILMMFKNLGYERLDTDLNEDNSIAIKLYSRCKIGRIGKGYSYIKEN